MAKELDDFTISQIYDVASAIRKTYPRGQNNGLCCYAAWDIKKRLDKLDIKCRVVDGRFLRTAHTWVQVPNARHPYVVDVTMDQFGDAFPRILIDKKKNWPQYSCQKKR